MDPQKFNYIASHPSKWKNNRCISSFRSLGPSYSAAPGVHVHNALTASVTRFHFDNCSPRPAIRFRSSDRPRHGPSRSISRNKPLSIMSASTLLIQRDSPSNLIRAREHLVDLSGGPRPKFPPTTFFFSLRRTCPHALPLNPLPRHHPLHNGVLYSYSTARTQAAEAMEPSSRKSQSQSARPSCSSPRSTTITGEEGDHSS
jgi:hypothetical protein